ncbi:MAG: D-alanine--D-alanine ligase [Planctomycetota bacterium]|nr:MAG: D-alanine--D-alanine ligase [Planctomycetota bacterium]
MASDNKIKVCVLMGGVGEEREISIQSGSCVEQALRESGIDVVSADISPEKLDILGDGSMDVFFIALHGRFGEDGQLQEILEGRSLVYTGSGPESSRRAFDKLASKRVFAEAGVATPAAIDFDGSGDMRQLEKRLEGFAEAYVVKPLKQGSTIGVSIVDDAREVVAAARRCQEEFGDCMIEEYIKGREVTVGILGNRALPVIEIRAKGGFYDYQAKYIDEETEFLFDTVEAGVSVKIQTDALRCFAALGLRHFARIDFRLGEDGKPYVLEANTIPGLTSHSLVPKAAAKAGISMSKLCGEIIEAALKDSGRNEAAVNTGMKAKK